MNNILTDNIILLWRTAAQNYIAGDRYIYIYPFALDMRCTRTQDNTHNAVEEFVK